MTIQEIENIHKEAALAFSRKHPDIIFMSSIKVSRFIWLIIKKNYPPTSKGSDMHPILATKEDDIMSAITSLLEKQLLCVISPP